MLEIPKLLEEIDYINKPLDFKWTEAMSEKAVARDVDQEKLLDILCQLNYKVVFGFGAAAGEWIFWRLYQWRPEISGKSMDATIQASKAHWLGLVDKYYIYSWYNTTKYSELPKNKDKIERPLWITLLLQEKIRINYIRMSPPLYGDITRLLLLARYLSGEDALFDSWLTDCLKRASVLFPNRQWPVDEELTRDNMDPDYDSNQDPFIPREFYFSPGFDYQQADLVAMQQDLLNQADYKSNRFLNPPEDMLEEGFQGIPYQLTLARTNE